MKEAVAFLAVTLFAGYMLYGMSVDIERLQSENQQTQARISELMKELGHRTHPATVQRETLKWIMREE